MIMKSANVRVVHIGEPQRMFLSALCTQKYRACLSESIASKDIGVIQYFDNQATRWKVLAEALQDEGIVIC